MSDSEKTELVGRMLGTGKDESADIWVALKPLECESCGAKISKDEFFTKAGRPLTPRCRNCRSFST